MDEPLFHGVCPSHVALPCSQLSTMKRKISGPSGLELGLTLTQLKKLRSSVIVEEVPESDPTPADPFADQLDSMIATLESRVNNPLLSFSGADDRVLERFNIVRKGMLYPKPEAALREAIVASRTLGSDKFWSNDNMYKHLSFLANSFTNKNETSSRQVIDTFFFRSTAMVPSPQKVIVMLENQVSAIHPISSQTDTIPGIIDYAAVVAESSVAGWVFALFVCLRVGRYANEMVAFFAFEAKATPIAVPLEEHLPQVLLQLVACAKHLGKSHIRGALTTGFKWHFIVVDLDADGDGAKYWVSELIEWKWKNKQGPTHRERLVEETSDESDPAFIASILSSWIPDSFTEFKGDKWFDQMPGGGGA
ncbi:hypothetical protein NMY22_g14712 [Coprinellus aureogranulatus]|nr:hypothetical protein NMY22_g14712 [Coprinellus aureogranulatus]